MKIRIITGLVLIAAILPCVYLGGIPFQVLIGIIAGAGVFEMLSICDRPKANIYLYPLVGLFVFYTLFLEGELLISSSILVLYLIVLAACSMFDYGMNFNRLCYYFTVGVLIAMGLHMVYQLRMSYGFESILLLALATFGTDTGAYFSGMLFGKHKLNPRLSPKKTIEGSIGGIILGTVLSVAFGSYIKMDLPTVYLIIICFVLTITSQIGDLTFSSIKRTFEVKDYSQLLPGHGGVLDRFDSFLFNAMVFGILLHFASVVITL
ncbi:MAG: phosphatidate cytidylyltransferase [Coprobacillus sp.]